MGAKVMSMRHVFVALVACVMLAALAAAAVAAPSQAYAAKGDPYEYTVRVFPGNIGECSAGDYLVNDEIAAGDVSSVGIDSNGTTLYFNGGTITLPSDSKYYIKGVRPSGEDELGQMAFTVDEDMDFVVAYGVKGEMVPYTISFVEYGTGNSLTADSGVSSVTYHGKVGDKPIVPYEYVTGYRPRYLNITGTLVDGPNNWTLEYIPLTVEETVVVETTETTTEGGAAAGGAAAGAAGAEGAAGAAAGAAGAEGAAGAAAGAAGAEGGAAATPPATEAIGDVDNPLASGTDTDNKAGAGPTVTPAETPGLPILPIVGIIAAAVIAIAAIAAVLGRSRQKR